MHLMTVFNERKFLVNCAFELENLTGFLQIEKELVVMRENETKFIAIQ